MPEAFRFLLVAITDGYNTSTDKVFCFSLVTILHDAMPSGNEHAHNLKKIAKEGRNVGLSAPGPAYPVKQDQAFPRSIIASTSMTAPKGRAATCKVLRAG